MSVLEKKAHEMIKEYNMLNDDDSIVIALSGGSDSCAMLYFFLTHRLQYKIYAAHLNHGIRGSDADKDEEFVKSLCTEYNIELFTAGIDVPKIAKETKKTLEEAARDERYAFFKEVCAKINAREKLDMRKIKIATAHTASDNAETIIFNIARGCGINGLCGIAPLIEMKLDGIGSKDDMAVIRPLLSCTKAEILEYCDENNISYVEDITNIDETYTRNYIRHSIAKSLKDKFPGFEENICKMTKMIQSDAGFIDRYVCKVIDENKINDSIDIKLLLSLDKAISSRIIIKMYANVSNGRGLEYRHVEYVEDTVRTLSKAGSRNKKINLPGNIIAEILYGRLIIKHKEREETTKVKYNTALKTGENIISDAGISIHIVLDIDDFENNIIKSSENVYNLFNHVLIDFDKIEGILYARNRQTNDEYVFFSQTKSVKKNYINYKIPAELRDKLPVLYDGKGIVWACGLPVCDRAVVTDSTSKIGIIEIIQV